MENNELPDSPAGAWARLRVRYEVLKLRFSLDPDEVPREGDFRETIRRRKVARFFLTLGILVLVSLLAFFPGRAAWHAYDSRARARGALALLARGDLRDAWEAARSAATIYPQAAPTAHALAVVAARTERWDRAVQAWDDFAQTGASFTGEDRASRVEALLAVGNAPAALRELDLARGAHPVEPPPHALLRARAISSTGDSAGACAALIRLLGEAATAPADRLAAIQQVIALREATPESLRLSSRELARLARGQGPVALAALRVASRAAAIEAAADPDFAEPLAPVEIARLLRAHPDSGFSPRLLALEMEILADPGAKDDAIVRAISEQRREATTDSLGLLAAWLAARREPGRVLDIVNQARAKESPMLAEARLDALIAVGKLREARLEVESQRYPIDPMLEQAFYARLLDANGESETARARWGLALKKAGTERPKLRRLAEIAREAGAEETAEAAGARVSALDRGWRGGTE